VSTRSRRGRSPDGRPPHLALRHSTRSAALRPEAAHCHAVCRRRRRLPTRSERGNELASAGGDRDTGADRSGAPQGEGEPRPHAAIATAPTAVPTRSPLSWLVCISTHCNGRSDPLPEGVGSSGRGVADCGYQSTRRQDRGSSRARPRGNLAPRPPAASSSRAARVHLGRVLDERGEATGHRARPAARIRLISTSTDESALQQVFDDIGRRTKALHGLVTTRPCCTSRRSTHHARCVNAVIRVNLLGVPRLRTLPAYAGGIRARGLSSTSAPRLCAGRGRSPARRPRRSSRCRAHEVVALDNRKRGVRANIVCRCSAIPNASRDRLVPTPSEGRLGRASPGPRCHRASPRATSPPTKSRFTTGT